MVIVEAGGRGGGHVFFSIVCRLSYEKGQEKNYQGNTALGKRQITAGEKKLKSASFLWTLPLSEAPNMA